MLGLSEETLNVHMKAHTRETARDRPQPRRYDWPESRDH